MPRKARKIQIPNNWEPRGYQLPLWLYLQNGGKRAVALWHRRAGKDEICLHWTAASALRRPGNYWHMLPQAAQARRAIWQAVNPHTGKRRIDEAFPAEIRKSTHNHEMTIELLNGAIWSVVGSDNFNSLVGSPPIGVVFSEWSLADPDAWAYLRPILLENDGWAMFVYTSRGNNHGATSYYHAVEDPDWFGQKLTVHDTGIFTEKQLISELHEYVTMYGEDYGRAIYDQEYMCSLSGAMRGSYYGRHIAALEKEGAITVVKYDPSYPVETWWDLGVNDPTSIWFVQRAPGQTRVLEYYENTGVGIPTYAKYINSKPYTYSHHVAPHDIEVRDFSGDGKTRKVIAANHGVDFETVPQARVDEGISAVQHTLPTCVFDKKKCEKGLNALKAYRAEFNDKHKVLRPNPLHDWTSHAADAFRTGAMFIPPKKDFKVLNYEKRRYA